MRSQSPTPSLTSHRFQGESSLRLVNYPNGKRGRNRTCSTWFWRPARYLSCHEYGTGSQSRTDNYRNTDLCYMHCQNDWIWTSMFLHPREPGNRSLHILTLHTHLYILRSRKPTVISRKKVNLMEEDTGTAPVIMGSKPTAFTCWPILFGSLSRNRTYDWRLTADCMTFMLQGIVKIKIRE